MSIMSNRVLSVTWLLRWGSETTWCCELGLDREFGEPSHFQAPHLLGVIAAQTRRTERAVELIKKAIGLNAKVAGAHCNLSNALQELKRPEDALACYDKAIALKPHYAEAY